ncbi:MAG: diguanylate cyclase [Lachnospiraceae bacterium]|nr:diguanylate cyclase [Lachnospiraceae bacterium]MDD7665123.1 diguanylate cyclase [Lachnospiraceae bacterium]MDY4165556.1 diguanylate cyclase [Lachnospiraceae bacterium]
MKKIALLMDSWHRFMIAAWPIGIINELKKKQIDASLYIFCCAGNWSTDEAYNEGEHGILSLPNFTEFDGVIVDFSNMHSSQTLQTLIEQIKISDIPAISLQRQIDGFTYIGADNYHAMKQMTAHLHEVHHLDRFWLMMGPEDNYESNVREKGIRDYLKENNLYLAKDDVVHVDFDYQAGVKGYHMLRSTHQELPEAIICVNDNQAIAVCEEAEKEGLKVPDDFAVTGFDNFDKASFYMPRITTMSNVREKMSATACDCLVDAWNGKTLPDEIYNPVDFLQFESCGCHTDMPDLRERLKTQVVENIDINKYGTELLDLEAEMPKCRTIKEVAEAVDEKLTLLHGDAFFMMVDPKVYSIDQTSGKPGSRENLTSNFCRGRYPLQMEIVYAREGNKREREFEGQMISDIFPLLSLDNPAEDYLFLPIHFRESSIGYIAFKNVTSFLDKQMYFQTAVIIQNRIQEMYREQTFESTTKRLSLLYKTDSLTGMINRSGFIEKGEAFFETNHRRGKQMFVVFVKIDSLKQINDDYGHKTGDRVICDMAHVMNELFSRDAVCARMGGGEFLGLGTFLSDEDLDDLKDSINAKINSIAKAKHLPFDLSISIGSSVVKASDNENLEHFVKMANDAMYEEKSKHRH